MALQTSWRCFAVENLDSATYKMFLRKRSNITASSLSSPKPKKSVSDEFTSLRLPLIFGFTGYSAQTCKTNRAETRSAVLCLYFDKWASQSCFFLNVALDRLFLCVLLSHHLLNKRTARQGQNVSCVICLLFMLFPFVAVVTKCLI